MEDPGTLFAVLSVAGTVAMLVAAGVVREIADRIIRRRPIPPRGRGKRERVRGRIRAIEQVLSPLSGVHCVIAWSIVESLVPREFATAKDFLLQSGQDVFLVRVDGLFVTNPTIDVRASIPRAPSADCAQALSRAGFPADALVEHGEQTIDEGDEIEIVGIRGEEPAPAAAGLGGYRGEPRGPAQPSRRWREARDLGRPTLIRDTFQHVREPTVHGR